MIVKVGLDGQAHVDHAPVTRRELLTRVDAAGREGDGITYYRESPETDGTDAAAETFAALLEARPRIRLGADAPSEWGTLTWVEMEEAPRVARFFMARGEKFLVSTPSSPLAPKPAVLVGGPMAPENEAGWLAQIDLLVRSDRVLETPPLHPELAMDDSVAGRPSLHLRIGYEERRWASWYARDEIPPHIESFRSDLWRVAGRLVAASARSGWRPLGAEEASRLFGE